ncbi:MAG: glycosyltransferase family 2 protein [Patescibacteria group bacterium]|nr:glycosyltransferase family 2 protein [Patescibacteria group bacterium]
MKKTELSLVIPLYNEKESLRELIDKTDSALKNYVFEYIFIDDGSTDDSFNELIRIKKDRKSAFKIVRFRKNQGKSAALSVGFKMAGGEKIVTLDADLQDSPEEIPGLLKKLDKGFDLVIGWRKDRQDPKNKIRLSHFFNAVVCRAANLSLHDMNSGLKVMKAEVAKEIELYGELHRFIPVLAVGRGFSVGEEPVRHSERKYGSSKFGRERIFHAVFDLITTSFLISFKNRPLQIFGPLGFLSGSIGLVILFYLSYLHFIGESIGRRPLLFLGILFVLFGVQIFLTGLLGELIISTHIQKEKKPISEIVE